jgi:ribosomal-protein-alanine N-acetyltransferase
MTEAKLGRFLIRDLNPWEGPAVFALTGDSKVMRYMGFAVHNSVDQATALLQAYKSSPSRFQAVCLDGEPTDLLGIVGLEVRGHQASMTLMLRRDWKARGVGREFCKPFIAWIFTHPQIWRVWSYVHVDNKAGQHVTEKLGAEREGRLRRFEYFPNVSELPQDCYIYSIVRG